MEIRGRTMNRNEKLDMLFNEDFYLMDFLPGQIPEGNAGFSDETEQYFLKEKPIQQFCDKAVTAVLKILCCYPFEMYVQEYVPFQNFREGWLKDKRCETVVKLLKRTILKRKGQLDILLPGEDAIISISGGRLNIAVYHGSDQFRKRMKKLAETEGLYWWKHRV